MTHLARRSFVLTGAAAALAASMPARAIAQAAAPGGPFKLDPLPYPPTKNEPHIDAQTMQLHHDKHHAAYVKNLNGALEKQPALAKVPLVDMLSKLSDVPESVRAVVRNNGGGHANHTMFWQIMGGAGGEPTGEVGAAIARDFGGFGKLKSAFNTAGAKLFGSGWVFVTVDGAGKLALTTRPNQDTPLMGGERVLFGNDVWEHAYYLKYQNRRPDYLAAWWNVVNWERVGQRYAAAKAGTLTI